jgi:hypothetical protein
MAAIFTYYRIAVWSKKNSYAGFISEINIPFDKIDSVIFC